MAYINKDVSTMAMPSGMNRMGQFPLDMSSVYYDLASLQAYATSGAVAYVGQILSLVDETNNTVTLYAIKNTAGDLVQIGTDIVIPEVEIPEYSGEGAVKVDNYKISVAVDDETIKIVDGKLVAIIPEVEIPDVTATDDDVVVLTAEGHALTASHAKKGPEGGAIKGATADASVSTFGGSIEFKVPHVTVDEYGHTTALDEKTVSIAIPEAPTFTDTNTTYGFVFDKETQKLTVTPSEGEAVELDLSDFLIASELPEDKNTEYHLEYSSDDKAIKLVAGADANKMSIDATPFIKDGMLSDVEYDAASNTLTFVWNTDSGLQADTVVLSDILDPYTASDKIVIDGSKISHATIAAPALVEGGSGRTYITELVSDGFGHITGYKVATETVVDTNDNDTYSAGNGINVSAADDNDNHVVSVKIATTESRLSFDENGGLQVDVSDVDTNDTYGAGNGIEISDDGGEAHTVSIKLADNETHLQVNENGLSIDLSNVDTDTTYTLSANNATIILTPSEGESQEVTLDVYTKGQTDQAIADKINEVNGGESAGEVLSSLNAYKKNIDTEIWGSEKVAEWTVEVDGKTNYLPDYTATSRIDALITELNSLTIDHIANLANELDNKINKTDVNNAQFEWINDQLNIKAVDSSLISGLDDLLNAKADASAIANLESLLDNKASVSSVSDLEDALNNYKTTTDARLDALEEAMTWGEMSDPVE